MDMKNPKGATSEPSGYETIIAHCLLSSKKPACIHAGFCLLYSDARDDQLRNLFYDMLWLDADNDALLIGWAEGVFVGAGVLLC